MNLLIGDKFQKLKLKALSLGAKDLKYFPKMNKKYLVTLPNGNKVHFGDSRYEDFLTHKDDERRMNYRKRASRIKDKYGRLTYLNPRSPNFWSYNLLW